jgi:hypothetical protein
MDTFQSIKDATNIATRIHPPGRRNGPTLTSLRLRPGVTIIAGGPASGKTSMLLNLLAEIPPGTISRLIGDTAELSVRVPMLPTPPVNCLVGPPDFACLKAEVQAASEGDLFLVDDIDLLCLESLKSWPPKEGETLLEALLALNRDAEMVGAFVVVALAIRIHPAGSLSAALQPSWMTRSRSPFPVFRLRGKR